MGQAELLLASDQYDYPTSWSFDGRFIGLQAIEVNYKTAADTLNDLANGAVDYIIKPFTQAVLKQKITAVLGEF